MSESQEMCGLSVNDFYIKLSEKVSGTNARLMLNSALMGFGYSDVDAINETQPLKIDDAKALCLELIKKGGPAFQVGKSMYHQI